MVKTTRTLPDFSNPPVIETVLGVQFNPLELFSIPHFGLYWSRIHNNYPKFEVQPPLEPFIESIEKKSTLDPSANKILLTPVPEVRCWFISQSETQLVQVQKDRFIFNWRKINEDDVYPHYDNIRPIFIEEWKRFCQYLNELDLGVPQINQCEVTYVNHIEIDKGWKSYGDLNSVISSWSGTTSNQFLPEPEMVSIHTRFVIPEKKGKLRIVMQPAIRHRDGMEILQLQLMARGKPISSNLEDILAWFDLGQEWIVRGFTDFTTEHMHKLWGRIL